MRRFLNWLRSHIKIEEVYVGSDSLEGMGTTATSSVFAEFIPTPPKHKAKKGGSMAQTKKSAKKTTKKVVKKAKKK